MSNWPHRPPVGTQTHPQTRDLQIFPDFRTKRLSDFSSALSKFIILIINPSKMPNKKVRNEVHRLFLSGVFLQYRSSSIHWSISTNQDRKKVRHADLALASPGVFQWEGFLQIWNLIIQVAFDLFS